MARDAISGDVIDASRTFLSQLDALEMKPQGVMWLYDHAIGFWRFYLVTSLIETIGPAKIMDLLIDTLEQSRFPSGFDLFDIRLREPSDPLMQGLSAFGAAGPDGLARFRNQPFDGGLYDGVVLRRLRAEPSEKEARAIGRRFAKNVRALRQAAE